MLVRISTIKWLQTGKHGRQIITVGAKKFVSRSCVEQIVLQNDRRKFQSSFPLELTQQEFYPEQPTQHTVAITLRSRQLLKRDHKVVVELCGPVSRLNLFWSTPIMYLPIIIRLIGSPTRHVSQILGLRIRVFYYIFLFKAARDSKGVRVLSQLDFFCLT